MDYRAPPIFFSAAGAVAIAQYRRNGENHALSGAIRSPPHVERPACIGAASTRGGASRRFFSPFANRDLRRRAQKIM
jgi:hypothetical protein